MNKKTTKFMATALTATMGAGIATQLVQAAEVTPYEAALEAVITMEKTPNGANIDKAYNAVMALEAGAQKDALYKRVEAVAAPHHKAVYDIMVTAREKKDLKTIGEARTAVAGMAKVFIKDAYTWSAELDTFTIEYQKIVVDTLNAIVNGKEEVEQATINELREIIVGLELQRSNEGLLKLVLDYSATLDTVQTKYIESVVKMVENAKTEADIVAARVAYEDLLTTTNDALKEALKADLGVKLVAKEAELGQAKVASVIALNATQLEIKFTKAIDSSLIDTASEANALIKLSKNGAKSATSVEISEDEKTVILTYGSPIEMTNGELVVEPIDTYDLDKNNQPIQTLKHAEVFTYADEVKPEIVKVVSSTNGAYATSVTVVATEPISSAIAKIDGKAVAINFDDTNVGRITGVNLDASKQHTIEVLNLTDKATNPNTTVVTSQVFSINTDKNAPTVSTSLSGEKEILLTFNKPMNAQSVEKAFESSNGKELVKDESLKPVQLGQYGSNYVKVVPGSNNTQFKIKVSDTLFSANKTSRVLTILFPNTIQDSLGNKMNVNTQNITVKQDTTKPAPTGYQVIKNNQGKVTKIVVKFNKALAGDTPALPTIVDQNGVLIPANNFPGVLTAAPIVEGDTEVVYNLTTATALSGQYSFAFGSQLVSDLAETANKSVAFNYTINFGSGSTETFELDKAYNHTVNNVLKVDFGRAVRGGAVTGSATDVNNYTLNGAALPEGTIITLDATQEIATITVPTGSIAQTDASAIFRVNGVKALDGATLKQYIGTIAVVDNAKPVMNNAVVNADGTLSLSFTENVIDATDAAAADFELVINGTTVKKGVASPFIFAPGSGSDAGKYVVSVKTSVQEAASAGEKDYLYIDADGSGDFNDAQDIVVASIVDVDGSTDNYTAGKFDLNKTNTLVIRTVDAPSIVTDVKADAFKAEGVSGVITLTPAANSLKGGTSITVR